MLCEREIIHTVVAQTIVDALKCQNTACALKVTGLTFSSLTLAIEVLQKRAQFIIENVLKNALALELLKNVLLQGDISIVFGSDTFSGANWSPSERKITINGEKTDPHTILRMFVFELNNSVNEKLNNVHFLDFRDPADYALKMEMCEFETYENTRKVVNFGLEQCQWPKCLYSMASELPITREEYLTAQYKPSSGKNGISHFNHYKLQYCDLKSKYLDRMIEKKRLDVAMYKLLADPEVPNEDTVSALLRNPQFQEEGVRKALMPFLSAKKENILNIEEIGEISLILQEETVELSLCEQEQRMLMVLKEDIYAEADAYLKNILAMKTKEQLESPVEFWNEARFSNLLAAFSLCKMESLQLSPQKENLASPVPEKPPLTLSSSLSVAKSDESYRINESINPAFASYRSYSGYKC